MINKKNFNCNHQILLDNPSTWPDSIIELINSNRDCLEKYIEQELQIDKEAQDNIIYRIKRPVNEYSNIWSDVIKKIDLEIANKHFLAFHCTRLTDYEINHINIDGLHPLNTPFTKKRIEHLLKTDIISLDIYREIINENKSNCSNRTGKIWFFHCLETLTDEAGLYKLFRYWGGEAIYKFQNSKIADEIKKIGKPCIIICSIKYEALKLFSKINEKMVYIIINSNKFINTYDFDSYVKSPLKALKIYTINDIEFEEYTNYKNWNEEIT